MRKKKWEEKWAKKRAQPQKDIPWKNYSKAVFTLLWLAKLMKSPFLSFLSFFQRINKKDGKNNFYQLKLRQKRDGGTRRICAPKMELRFFQRRINTVFLKGINPAPSAFGFSGSRPTDAVSPHLGNDWLLSVDLKDAFPSVSKDDVFEFFCQEANLSWYAAKILEMLTTFEGCLPQGAPTSPRLFDLICRPLDDVLQEIAAKVNGTYTRYADNIFFSLKGKEFPRPIKNAILTRIEGKRRGGPTFLWHKLRISRLGPNSARLLGLNIIDGDIHNTRSFKRRLRLAIHHVSWLLENDQREKEEEAWHKLNGWMGFAEKKTLPPQALSRVCGFERENQNLSPNLRTLSNASFFILLFIPLTPFFSYSIISTEPRKGFLRTEILKL